MFRKLIHNRKAQNTAEYALLIALVVAGVIAMQTYAQRSLQGRVRDAADFMTSDATLAAHGFTLKQYEPYYLQSSYTVNRYTNENQNLAVNLVYREVNNTRYRTKGGFQVSTFNEAGAYGVDNDGKK